MDLGQPSSLLSLQPWQSSPRGSERFRKFLASSLAVHLLFLFLMVSIRLPNTVERPPTSYQVNLISLSQLNPSASPSPAPATKVPTQQAQAKVRKVSPKPGPPPERLSETFAGELQSIAIPEQRSLKEHSIQEKAPELQGRSEVPQDASLPPMALPPEVPDLASATLPSTSPKRVEPLAKSEPLTESVKQAVGSVSLPSPSAKASSPHSSKSSPQEATRPPTSPPAKDLLPDAPKLAAVAPLPDRNIERKVPSKSRRLTEQLNQAVDAVDAIVIPQPAPPKRSAPSRSLQTPPATIPKDQAPVVREPITKSLSDVIQSIRIPEQQKPLPVRPKAPRQPLPSDSRVQEHRALKKARAALKNVELPPTPPDLTKVEPKPSSLSSPDLETFKAEVGDQIAKLTVPEVQIPQLDRPVLERVKQRRGTNLSVSGAASASNPYWGEVRERIDREWVAAPVEVSSEEDFQAVVTFRLERDGTVRNVTIEKSSGNRYYDLSAKRAILAAAPLPRFLPRMKESHYNLRFKFTLGKD